MLYNTFLPYEQHCHWKLLLLQQKISISKIADGMTIEVGTVNLMIETHGGGRAQGGATWASPLASITMHKLLLYTTNDQWQVVNLKEARDFSNGKKNIYVFKKLEWESLSADLLPHPDMFLDASLTCSDNGANRRDDDGAKRVFFGGERFLEGISGEAYITIQRTELNSPLGLEVQLHVPEAVCPALSEPGLRALLRFMTGFYVCLNRGDVDPRASQQSTEAAGRSLVSIIVDHIFLCIKDAEFQLELLMQSLFFSRASVSDGENTKNLSRITLGGLFLRDTFSHPPCTLVQPSMNATTKDPPDVPEFGMNICPPIYPLGDQKWQLFEGVPLLCLYSLQMKPSPAPPFFASQTVIDCQPLVINLQEESCLRITSFLADGIVVNPGSVLPDFSINSLTFSLKELDLTVPLEPGKFDGSVVGNNHAVQNSFAGARLHIENLIFSESPTIKLPLLNLEKDPACFLLWEGQPIDASQRKYTIQSSHLSLSLETYHGLESQHGLPDWSMGLWRCVELHHISVEAAMVTADGAPLKRIPPPGGVVRIGVACKEYLSNTSVEQLFFVLDLYVYLGSVSEKIAKVGKRDKQKRNEEKSLSGGLIDKVPSDTAVILNLKDLQLRFMESSFMDSEVITLVQFGGQDMFVRVSHRTLGGAIAVSSSIRWESVQLDCVDDGKMDFKNLVEDVPTENIPVVVGNGHPLMRAVFWIDNTGSGRYQNGALLPVPFLEINVVHVMPFDAQDMECHSLSVSAKVAGVRLGGGMKYTEALLHRFGILGPDGGPGKGLSKGLKNLSAGPLSKLLSQSPLTEDGSENGDSEDGERGGFLELAKPEDVDVSIELNNWLFALEGEQEMAELWWFGDEKITREERCWHTMFQSLKVKGKSSPNHVPNGGAHSLQSLKYPIELITVGVEGLRALKPLSRKNGLRIVNQQEKPKKRVENSGGINLEAHLVVSNDAETVETPNWVIENLKFSVAQPIEAVATKEELQHLAGLCKSEVDSMGRITAGILKLLKLDATIGQATIDQLSNLGSESLGKIFTSEKLSRQSSGRNMASTTSSNAIKESPLHNVELTLASLESAISDSHAKCSALIAEVGNLDHPEKQQPLADMKELSQKIESMQMLLRQLRTQI